MQVAVQNSYSGNDLRGISPLVISMPGITFNTNPKTTGQFSSRLGPHAHDVRDFSVLMRRLEAANRSPFYAYDARRMELVGPALEFGDKNKDLPQHVSLAWTDPLRMLPDKFSPVAQAESTNPRVRIVGAVDEIAALYYVPQHKDTRNIEPENLSQSLALLASKAVEYWVRKQQALSAGQLWDETVNDEVALVATVAQIVRVRNFYLATGHVPRSDEFFANFDGDDINDTIDGGPDFGDFKVESADLLDPARLAAKVAAAQALADKASAARDATVEAVTEAKRELDNARKAAGTAITGDANAEAAIERNAEKTRSLANRATLLAGETAKLRALVASSDPASTSGKALKDSLDTQVAALAAVQKQLDTERNLAAALRAAKASAVTKLNETRARSRTAEQAFVTAQTAAGRAGADLAAKQELAAAIATLRAGQGDLQAQIDTKTAEFEKLDNESRVLWTSRTEALARINATKANIADIVTQKFAIFDRQSAAIAVAGDEKKSKAERAAAELEAGDLSKQWDALFSEEQEKDAFLISETVAFEEKKNAWLAKRDQVGNVGLEISDLQVVLDAKQQELEAARATVTKITTKVTNAEAQKAADGLLGSTMSRKNVLLASCAVEADIVDAELQLLRFPSMVAQNARLRQQQARKAVALLRRARLTLAPGELAELRAASWRPTLTFVSNRSVKIETDGETFTRNYEPSLQAAKAMRALLAAPQ